MKRSPLNYSIFLLLASVILGSSVTHASSLHHDLAIREHLSDATVLNRERAPLYAKLTDNESLELSHELIFMENLAKVATIHLDLKARKFVKKGVLLFKEDLIDMKKTPSFQPKFNAGETPTQRVPIETKAMKKHWLSLVRDEDLEGLYAEALFLLDEGDLRHKNQNCLTRHFVESIARSIMNLETHRAKAESLGLDDPKKIVISFLKIQIHSLGWTRSLDKRAYKIQAQGVPLFCQDVPQIPYHHSEK